jgi:hypothetical protein
MYMDTASEILRKQQAEQAAQEQQGRWRSEQDRTGKEQAEREHIERLGKVAAEAAVTQNAMDDAMAQKIAAETAARGQTRGGKYRKSRRNRKNKNKNKKNKRSRKNRMRH